MSSRSSSRASDARNDAPLLPLPTSADKVPPYKIRSYFARFLYRKVFIWSIFSLIAVSIVLYTTRDSNVYDVASHQFGHATPAPASDEEQPLENTDDKGDSPKDDEAPAPGAVVVVLPTEDDEDDGVALTAEDKAAKKQYEEDLKKMPWLRFKHLNAYFNGLKTLVPKSEHIPEYPNVTQPAPFPPPPKKEETPKPKPYIPYDTSNPSLKTCYIDANETIPAPNIYAYEGVPQNFPDPAIGSYDVLGLRDDVCFDRFGRYGPYGLGYTRRQGGTGTGLDTESSNSAAVWEESGMIDFENVDWADAQDRCYDSNKAQFKQLNPETQEYDASEAGKMPRIAVVIRIYTGFKWTEHAILNFRALINELSLKSGGEYQVHFLLHVRDVDTPIWADEVTVQRLLDANIPPEFQGLVTLWSEPQMKLFYPGHFGDAFSNPSGGDIHGVYRSAHFPLQVFAVQHPEYDHFWNWEMDMRFLGSYYELFDRMGKWGKKQSRSMIWERAARYYIPEHHKSWENFTQVVQEDTARSGLSTPMGSLRFPGRKSLRFEAKGGSPLPDDCDSMDRTNCGVGEEADLITLNPIFDTDQSGWVFGLDATGYSTTPPPRRAAIVTASRISRRLLLAMHEEVWRHHHTMFSEMFPPSVAFHHGFKAVFAPHPVYLDRAWNPFGSSIDEKFNGGRDHSTSGSGSPFDLSNEHNHKGSTWYYNSEFAGLLWRRWLGYAQMDGRGKFGGRGGEGKERGGYKEEKSESSSGRMCLRSMLVHPIKHEHPAEK